MGLSNIMQIFQLATGHQWLPLAILVVGVLTNLTSDTSKLPVSIPDRYKPLLAVVLGQLYAVLEAVQGGSVWTAAIGHGLLAAFSAIGLNNLLVNVIFNGTPPAWLSWLSGIDPKLAAAKKAGKLLAPLFGKPVVAS